MFSVPDKFGSLWSTSWQLYYKNYLNDLGYLATFKVFFEKKISFHKTNLQKNRTYNTKHYTQKKNKGKKETTVEILKKKEKDMAVAIMSFKQSRDIIRSRCSAYILFMQSAR